MRNLGSEFPPPETVPLEDSPLILFLGVLGVILSPHMGD